MRNLTAIATILLLAGCGGSSGRADGDPLAGTAWTLDLPAGTEATVTLRFDEGRIGGNAGCNQYFASYTVKGDSLRIGPAGATKMMCPEPVMAVEDAFLAALADITTYRLTGGRLQLKRTAGDPLVFGSAPFEAKSQP